MNLRDYLSSKENDLLGALKSVTSIVEHDGETGKNLELEIGNFIKQYLPNKYELSTGFVRSIEDLEWQSSQIDLIITRNDIGHPLAVFQNMKVFPIESVVGFIEVTKTLNKQKLETDFLKVQSLKHKTLRSYNIPYVFAKAYGFIDKGKEDEKSDVLKTVNIEYRDLEPRFFYFAFSTDWKKISSLCKTLKELGKKYNVHCHGLFIPKIGWFMHEAVCETPSNYDVRYTTKMPDALIGYIYQIISSIQSFTDIFPSATIPLYKYGNISPDYNIYK